MNFDEYLKRQAKKDMLLVPQRYHERIDSILKSLVPARTYIRQTHRRNPKLRVAAVIIAVVLAVCGTAFAIGYILKMQGSEIGFFAGAQEQDFVSQQKYWEDTSDKVGVTVPNEETVTGDFGVAVVDEGIRGVSLVVDNIAMDMNYLHIFYTVTSERPFREVIQKGMGLSDEEMHEQNDRLSDETLMEICMQLRPKIDGQVILPFSADGRSGEGYFKDQHTYVGTVSYALVENIPQTFALTVGTDRLLFHSGLWEASFDVDLTDVFAKSKVVYPEKTISVRDGQGEEHSVTIKRVSLTSNGGMIVLEEQAGQEKMPYVDFMVTDKEGNSLSRATLGGTHGGEKDGGARNILEFSADADIDSVQIVPYTVDYGNTKEVRMMFDEIGQEKGIFPGASIALTEIVYDAQTEFKSEINTSNSLIIKYIEKGVPISSPSKSRFLDADGNEASLAGVMTPEIPYRDFATGIYTSWSAVEFEQGDVRTVQDLKGMIFEYYIPEPDMAQKVEILF